MTNEQIRACLLELAEGDYKEFSAALVPGCKNMLGIRLPKLRELARAIAKEDFREYLDHPWDKYFEEVMIQGMVIGYAKADIEELLTYVTAFIPKISNWSVNDSFCSGFKIASKNRERVWDFLMGYLDCGEEFPLRVIAIMLMDHFLVDEYIDKVLEVYNQIHHAGYYTKMGVAWGIATAYAKFPKKTMVFLKDNKLDDVTYNKAIQKMIESFRVLKEDKEILRSMKRV